MPDSEQKADSLPERLCSEIQLFDLCDLTSCSYKRGRFCTNSEVLSRFEKISEDEPRPAERYISEEIDDVDDDDEYDDEFEMENFEGNEDDDWEDDR